MEAEIFGVGVFCGHGRKECEDDPGVYPVSYTHLGPIWDLHLDYKCGTGHGIGYLLNVHEAPNGFRWKIVAERRDSAVFEEGMVTTDEPVSYTHLWNKIR